MANKKNLIPGAHKLTVEEQSKGGIASGEARRERQRIRKAIQDMLDNKFDVDGEQVTGDMLIARKIYEVIQNPMHKNWFDTVQLIIKLTDSDISPEALAIKEAKEQKAAKLAEFEAQTVDEDIEERQFNRQFSKALNEALSR